MLDICCEYISLSLSHFSFAPFLFPELSASARSPPLFFLPPFLHSDSFTLTFHLIRHFSCVALKWSIRWSSVFFFQLFTSYVFFSFFILLNLLIVGIYDISDAFMSWSKNYNNTAYYRRQKVKNVYVCVYVCDIAQWRLGARDLVQKELLKNAIRKKTTNDEKLVERWL